jgi:hypothetical protein
MVKKTVLITNLIILSCSCVRAEYFIEELQRVREQEPVQQEIVQEQEVMPEQQEVAHEEVPLAVPEEVPLAVPAEEEPVFDDFDQPEIAPQLVETHKPSIFLKFLAKGYPIFAWCVSVKKSMVARLIVFKNSVKNWFGLHQSDLH